MLRPFIRSALLGASLAAIVSIPSTAAAQEVLGFTSCSTPGVCGWVQAMLDGSLLRVRVQNSDNSFGSALFSAQLIFASALGTTPGSAFSAGSTVDASNAESIGTTSPGGWFFNGVGGSTVLDLASFFNVYIEGAAASPYRAGAGDPDIGTWVTTGDGYVQFNGDLSGVAGVAGGQIKGLGFCTDQDCVSGNATVVTPEPASMTLLATGLAGMAAYRRRRKNRLTV